MRDTNFLQICKTLKEKPTRDIWLEFANELKNTNIRYYSITYRNGKIDNEQDLTASYSTLYDEMGKPIVTIPIWTLEGTQARGALYFLRGLSRKKGGRFE